MLGVQHAIAERSDAMWHIMYIGHLWLMSVSSSSNAKCIYYGYYRDYYTALYGGITYC